MKEIRYVKIKKNEMQVGYCKFKTKANNMHEWK